MLTMSKPLGPSQAKEYYREEYSNAEVNYYNENETIRGAWSGILAEEIGLQGAIDQEQFDRLVDGRDPHTGEQLIRHVGEHTVTNKYGEVMKNKSHRAGYDATFSAPKSVSLAALVGNDGRVREAHRAAVNKALVELEKYTQARLGNVRPAVTTEKFIAAIFEHDTARPDKERGYAAPQLHTHAVIFNMTRLESGKWHALQPLELYRSQQYATAVYRAVLAEELQKLGYEIEVRNGAPEIKGFTPEYLEANSPRAAEVRREAVEIKARLEAEGHTVKDGAGLRQAAATRRRSGKQFDPEEMRARHQELESTHGNQSHRAVERALYGKGIELSPEEVAKRAQESVTFARDHAMSREAVMDFRRFKADALRRNLGLTTYEAVMDVISARRGSGELIDILERNRPSQLTTQRMLELETGNIKTVLEGKRKQSPIVELRRVDSLIDEASRRQGIRLNEDQSQAVRGILTSEDRIVALQGRAGTGKTTAMRVLREAAERNGYVVRGITPTHKARKELEKSGIHSQTLYSFVLQQKNAEPPPEKRLYVLDESSLADTVKIERLFDQVGPGDRIILVGDRTQHQAVEAGAPFEQFQKRGVTTIFLSENVRQKDPVYRRTVNQVSLGEIRGAVEGLNARGKVIEIADDRERMSAIAKEFVLKDSPTIETLVISPANKERVELNSLIHRELQDEGRISRRDYHVVVLTNRQEMSGAERGFAGAYQPVNFKEGNTGDVIRYSRGSKKYGIERGEYARVTDIDFKSNTITVRFEEGRELTYDPRRLQGVNVYGEAKRDFAEGDRIQFRASFERAGKSGSQAVNGELGVIRKIEGSQFRIETESGRMVSVDVMKFRHLDHGYAVTSHSSQGQTVDRVIINADTRESAVLLNRRMAYVALSRAREDGLIFTNSLTELSMALDRRRDKEMALESWSNQTSYEGPSVSREHSGPGTTNSFHHQEPQRPAEPEFSLGI
jgi:conjugative relaxase-like TrwC/TraI family protein